MIINPTRSPGVEKREGASIIAHAAHELLVFLPGVFSEGACSRPLASRCHARASTHARGSLHPAGARGVGIIGAKLVRPLGIRIR